MMTRTIYFFVLILFFTVIGCSSGDAPDEMSTQPDIEQPDEDSNEEPNEPETVSIEERLQRIVNSKVYTNGLRGVSVSIRVDGEERWTVVGGSSGEAENISSDMRFGIASITKTVVGATILKLEEEGLLTLDDTISDWLALSSVNVDNDITIFQLLNHLTGLEGYFKHPDIWPRVEGNLDLAIPSEELVDYIGVPIFQAGERFEYSNSNYLILGLIIKEATGLTVGEAFRTRFWAPLELNDIYFGLDEEPTGPIAVPWRDTDGNGSLEDISDEYRSAYHSIFFTAADVFSTASDLSMWAYHLFGGDALTENSKTKMVDFLFIDTGFDSFDGYGLGVRRINLAGRETWGHTGGMRGYGSYMIYEPISGVSIAMLNNQSRSENGPLLRFELTEELLAEVLPEL